MPRNKVNLFVVGAPKSGTTTLYEYFNAHHEILCSIIKEPHYFGEYKSPKSIDFESIEEYESIFKANNKNFRYIADFTPSYLYSKLAPKQIKEYNPNSKIIAILRNPVDRTLSMYHHQRRSLLEPLSIKEALLLEQDRIQKGYGYGFHYKNASLYSNQIKTYLSFFGSNFKVIIFEDFIKNPENQLNQISKFLGLETDFCNTRIHTNKTGEPKSIWIQKLFLLNYPGKNLLRNALGNNVINYILELNTGRKQNFDDTILKELYEFFINDIVELEKILNIKTGWIKS